jgi:rare lipoprotein A
MYEVTAAHKSLPIPTYARVTRLDNGRSIVVKITDRGPFVDERIIDLSYVAATKLGMIENGTAPVEVAALPPYQTLTRNWSNPSLFTSQQIPNASEAPATYYADAVLPVQVAAAPAPTAVRTPVTADPAASAFVKTAYLQIGAFSLRDSAEQLRLQLAQKLGQAVVLDSRQAGIYRVRVGPVKNPPDLDMLQKRLASLGFSETQIVFE